MLSVCSIFRHRYNGKINTCKICHWHVVTFDAFPQEDDLDEDALLGGSDEEAEYIKTLTHEADSTTYDEQIVGRGVKEETDTSREYIELQLPDECDEDFDEEWVL